MVGDRYGVQGRGSVWFGLGSLVNGWHWSGTAWCDRVRPEVARLDAVW
jgi:hypothetical protein